MELEKVLREYNRRVVDNESSRWDGIERRQIIEVHDDKPPEKKPTVPVTVWLPLLYAIVVGIGGYVLSMHDTVIKLTYDYNKMTEKFDESKLDTKSLKDSIEKIENHMNSIESTLIELLRSNHAKRN